MTEEASEGSGSFVVKNIQNIHLLNIDVVKFNGTNNFGLWRCEVLDALNVQNLEDSLELQEKPTEMEEKVRKKMNRMMCGVIRSCLSQDLKYDVTNETSAKKIYETREQILNEERRESLAFKDETLLFSVEDGSFY